MAASRRKFRRPLGERPYKKLFLIAAEGIKTEAIYFGIFSNDNSTVQVDCLKSKHGSSPPQVLDRMTKRLRSEKLKASDEAWLVEDRFLWGLLQKHTQSHTEQITSFDLPRSITQPTYLRQFASEIRAHKYSNVLCVVIV